MSDKRPFPNSELTVGLGVVLAGFVIEHLVGHFPPNVFLFTVALVALSIIITALICRIHVQNLTKDITKTISDEVRASVDKSLNLHMAADKELTEAANRATMYLQASLPDSALRKVLLTADVIRQIEGHTKEQVYVVLRDLHFDQEIDTTVVKNLRNGITYYYLHPEGVLSDEEINDFKLSLELNTDVLRKIKFVSIPKEHFNFPTDMVVYDPHKQTRSGYVRLPSDEMPGGIRAVLIKDGDPLRDLSAYLQRLIKNYASDNGYDHGEKFNDPRK